MYVVADLGCLLIRLRKSTSKLRAVSSAEDTAKEDLQVQSGTLEQLLDIVIPFDGIPGTSSPARSCYAC